MGLFRRAESEDALDFHAARDDDALRAACEAAKDGDWTAGRDLMAVVRSDFDRRSYCADVLGEVAAGSPWRSGGRGRGGQVDTGTAWTDRWVHTEPSNPDAVLVRAVCLTQRGWAVRGSGRSGTVSRDAFAEFHRVLALAVPLCHQAAQLAPHDPTPWSHLILLGTALGAHRENVGSCWAEVRRRDPLHRQAHHHMLNFLCEKWRGSHEEMFAFARQAAGAAPDGSPLHVLPLVAYAEWALATGGRPGSAGWQKSYEVRRTSPVFRAEVDSALHRWFALAPARHARWYDDLNYLAWALHWAERYADAAPVFEAIGRYAAELPWAYEYFRPKQVFLPARRKARRAAGEAAS